MKDKRKLGGRNHFIQLDEEERNAGEGTHAGIYLLVFIILAILGIIARAVLWNQKT